MADHYKSKYLDLYDKIKLETQKQKTSILEDIDFELELIHRDKSPGTEKNHHGYDGWRPIIEK